MSKNTNSTGISFTGMLAILFIGLKLTGFIKWSWWWILSPLWIVLALVLAVALIIIIIQTLSKWGDNKK